MKLTRFLILSFVTVCYLQATLEINTEGIDNVWGDTYDTYLCSNSSAPQTVIKKEITADLLTADAKVLPEIIIHNSFDEFPTNSFQEHQKIFLRFRSLRI